MGKSEKGEKRAKTKAAMIEKPTEEHPKQEEQTKDKPKEAAKKGPKKETARHADSEDSPAPMPPLHPASVSPELNLRWLVLFTSLVLSSALCYQWMLPRGSRQLRVHMPGPPPLQQPVQKLPEPQQQHQEQVPVREEDAHKLFQPEMSGVAASARAASADLPPPQQRPGLRPGETKAPVQEQSQQHSPPPRPVYDDVRSREGKAQLGKIVAPIVEQDPSSQRDSRGDDREKEDPAKTYSKKVGYTIFAVGEEDMYEDEFNYVRQNDDLCYHNTTEKQLVIFVLSDVHNVMNRHIIRDTWGSTFFTDDWRIQTVFMIGRPHQDSDMEEELESEYLRMEDMIQGDFVDHPKNSTIKHLMALHWLQTRCTNATMFVQVDDETFVHTMRLTAYLDGRYTGKYEKYREKVLQCSVVQRHQPIREPSDPAYVGWYEYPYEKYPTHCVKHAYLISPDMVNTLYRSSQTSLRYWMDDVYVTGLIPHHLGIPLRAFEKDYGITEEERIQEIEQVNNYNFVHMPEVGRAGSTIGKWINMWTSIRGF